VGQFIILIFEILFEKGKKKPRQSGGAFELPIGFD
jgi:hypothetical protein